MCEKCNILQKEIAKLRMENSRLKRGIFNCISASFYNCPKCGELCTNGWICWNCGTDPTIKEDLDK